MSVSIDPGTYTIQQKKSELYLDCAQDSKELHLSEPHGGHGNPYQRWIVGSSAGFFIIMQQATQRVWHAEQDLGEPVILRAGNIDNTYERWKIEREDGSDYWTIVQNSQYGNYVDCVGKVDEQPHLAQHNLGNPYQLWSFTAV
jgi:hypothetical protein